LSIKANRAKTFVPVDLELFFIPVTEDLAGKEKDGRNKIFNHPAGFVMSNT
jgi:hypothetical protein